MIRFGRILCPVDFSEGSRAALRYAAWIAARSKGRLIVLSVSDPLLVAAAVNAYNKAEIARATHADLRKFVGKSLTDRTLARRVRYGVAVGKPALEILKAARRVRADLIVMGTRGLSGVSRLLIGSTTEHVLRKATVPVLAVRGRRTHLV